MSAAGRVLVSGMICAQPRQGGATWAVLQFLLGLRRLGWEVHFVETLERAAILPNGAPLALSGNAAYLAETMSTFGLEGAWSLLQEDGGGECGVSRRQLSRFAASADLLLNISGSLTDPELLAGPALRAYVDLDPAFTQLWHAVEGIDMGFDHHQRFVTVGQSIGEPSCPIPTCGRDWIGIPPPVVLEHWPVSTAAGRPEMTTIGHWRGYGSLEHAGSFHGQRAHTMRQLLRLPALTDQPFLLALAIHPGETADLAALAAHGWLLIEPASVASDPLSYRSFVSGSHAELGIPKSGYVVSGSAWFSDRSACYLASGRPVIAGSTGFEAHLPTGRGLLSYRDVEEAAGCVAEVRADYGRHRLAARRLAEEHLDSDLVLARMLAALATAPAPQLGARAGGHPTAHE